MVIRTNGLQGALEPGWLSCVGGQAWARRPFMEPGVGHSKLSSDSAAEPSVPAPSLYPTGSFFSKCFGPFQRSRQRSGWEVGAMMVFVFLNAPVDGSATSFCVLICVLSSIGVTVISLASHLSPSCCNSSEGAFGRVLGEERNLASAPGTWSY